jgi:hypothetical protein
VPISEQTELAERGVLLERRFTTPYTGKVTWETMENIRAAAWAAFVPVVRPRRARWPAGGGRVALMADYLLKAGFSEDEVRTSRGQHAFPAAASATRVP